MRRIDGFGFKIYCKSLVAIIPLCLVKKVLFTACGYTDHIWWLVSLKDRVPDLADVVQMYSIRINNVIVKIQAEKIRTLRAYIIANVCPIRKARAYNILDFTALIRRPAADGADKICIDFRILFNCYISDDIVAVTISSVVFDSVMPYRFSHTSSNTISTPSGISVSYHPEIRSI